MTTSGYQLNIDIKESLNWLYENTGTYYYHVYSERGFKIYAKASGVNVLVEEVDDLFHVRAVLSAICRVKQLNL